MVGYRLSGGPDVEPRSAWLNKDAIPEPPVAPQPPGASDQEKFGTAPEDNSREFCGKSRCC